MLSIETAGLTKYYGKSRGIEDLTMEVPEGQIFGFIGPNGAGKSTTIRILLGFLSPTRGSGRLLGREVTADNWEVRSQIGYVPGEVSYYDDMRVRELLEYAAAFFPGASGERRRELAEIFSLDMDKRIGSLSLGNKKKVALVQALQHRPRLLILDEPTSSLDPLIQARFFSILLEENRRGTTIFFSSHVLSEVQRLCHTVAIIREGRLVAVEDVKNLQARQFKRVKVELGDGAVAPTARAESPADHEADADGVRALLDLPGVTDVSLTSEGRRVATFLFRGDSRSLLNALAAANVVDVWIEEPSLEDIFLSYYDEEAGRDED